MPATILVQFTLRELVDRFGGTCGGDLERTVIGFAALEDATPEHLAFVTAARYRNAIESSAAAAVLVTDEDAGHLVSQAERLWTCRDPYLQFARIAQYIADRRREKAIHCLCSHNCDCGHRFRVRERASGKDG